MGGDPNERLVEALTGSHGRTAEDGTVLPNQSHLSSDATVEGTHRLARKMGMRTPEAAREIWRAPAGTLVDHADGDAVTLAYRNWIRARAVTSENVHSTPYLGGWCAARAFARRFRRRRAGLRRSLVGNPPLSGGPIAHSNDGDARNHDPDGDSENQQGTGRSPGS